MFPEKNKEKKHYHQKYKRSWENEKEFRGWLVPVEGDATKAACRLCKCLLVAHKKTLMFHGASKKHKLRMSDYNSNDDSDIEELSMSALQEENQYASSEVHYVGQSDQSPQNKKQVLVYEKNDLLAIACQNLKSASKDDQFLAFAVDLAGRLKELNKNAPTQRIIVQKLMSDIMFYAELNKLTPETHLMVPSQEIVNYPITVITEAAQNT